MHQTVTVRNTVVIAILFLGAVSISGQAQAVSPAFATVHLRIVSTYGFHAEKALIRITDKAGESYDAHVRGSTIERIPFGEYQLDIESPMLDSHPIKLAVERETMYVTLGFKFSEPVDRWIARPSALLKGEVETIGQTGEAAWIKVVGIYSDTVVESQTDERGFFIVRNLPDGLYLLIVTKSGYDPVDQVVRLREYGPDVEVKVRPQRSGRR